jgi:uncharacterized protein DUF87
MNTPGPILTPAQFKYDLAELYAHSFHRFDNRPLPTEYLSQLLTQISHWYGTKYLGTTLTDDGYKLLLATFLQSLIAYSRAYPYPHLDSNILFAKPIEILTSDGILEPKLASALLALRQPFVDSRGPLQAAGVPVNDWSPPFYFEFSESKPIEPYSREFSDRYNWRQELENWKDEKRRYDSLRKEALETLAPLKEALLFSPYYTFPNVLSTDTKEPFEISEKSWFEGCWVVGASGAGKSNLLRHLILHRLEQDATVIIIDSKGNLDLLRSFHRLAVLKDRLVILRNTAEHPLAINPFDTPHPDEFLDYLFSIFNAGLTANQTIPFSSVIRLLRKTEEPTLNKFWEILAFGAAGYQDEIQQLSETDQYFFNHDTKDAQFKQRAAEVRSRLKLLIDHPILGPVLSSVKTRVKMGELLESGKVICIDNNTAMLGVSGAEFMGRLFIALIWYAAQNRTGNRPVYVFLDEAHHFIKQDRHIGDMITSLRSQRISLVFAHQFVSQIKDEDARGGLNTCGIKFFNTTGENLSAGLFFPGADQQTYNSLPRGSFATFVKFKPNGNFNVLPVIQHKVIDPEDTVPTDPNIHTFADTKAYPLMSDDAYGELIRDMQERYSAKPHTPPLPEPECEAPTPPAEFDFTETIWQRTQPKPKPQAGPAEPAKGPTQPIRRKFTPPPPDSLEDW